MSGWLPVTARNRVALGLAFAAPVIFVAWNSLYVYVSLAPDSSGKGIAAFRVWPEVFHLDLYKGALMRPDIDSFINITASLAVIQCGFVTLAAVPFWKALHASPYIWMPLAYANLIGAGLHFWFMLFDGLQDPTPNSVTLPLLIALNMFTLFAALFTFRNELALREERSRPVAH